MTTWQAFLYQGTVYDLSHLDSFDHVFVQAATAEKPERQYKVRIHTSATTVSLSRPNLGMTRPCCTHIHATTSALSMLCAGICRSSFQLSSRR
ncbi:hypothetical protein [Deinococcus fonticola]|uniref:hypothetical protein n=1 Tax=Deinococcus fonticola TaxID=2528713 RepID=UPI00107564A0|nr:hypothetical protein [Deinococcus fonticola]